MTSRPLGRIIRPNGRDEGSRYYACRNFRWLSNDNSNSGSRLIEKTTNVKDTERVRIEESGTKTDVTRLISARMATEFERGLYYGKNE